MRRPLLPLLLLGLAAVEQAAALRTVTRAAKSQLLFQSNETEAFAASVLTKSDDDDMASLRRRTLEPLLPAATHIGSAVSAAKQAASSLAANGSWPDIWYGDVSHGANDHWQPAAHLSRLSGMVTPLVACNVSGNSLCNDTSLGAKVSAALNFWLTRNPW